MSLAEDVMITILSRLSMKVLLRCRSVCKSWKALIASPHFIKTHLNCNRIDTPQHLIRSGIPDLSKPKADSIKETYFYYCNNETFDLLNKFDVPWVADKGIFGALVSCNGLICLTACDKHDVPVYLWNPLINKAVYIPEPIYVDDSYKPKLGFGFDIATNDYKLVRFTRTPKVELYRLSTRIWEDITHLAPSYNIYAIPVYVHGAAHWFAADNRIVLFDMHSEVFREMRLSSSLENNLMSSFGLTGCLLECQGSLSMLHVKSRMDTIWKWDIWFMKEYGVAESWVMQFSVNLDHNIIPLGFLNNGEILLKDGNNLTLYDHQSEQFRVLMSSQDLYPSTSAGLYLFYVGQYWERDM